MASTRRVHDINFNRKPIPVFIPGALLVATAA
jgi:hypothetical protein